ncbi:carbon catabolite repressor protein 4 homolog 1-like isoform X1 [Coffea eugenioides]|uniref:carbon catabolite repressor protein 4 homolog 1-like isoform X1 n=1 Tax=Coffea eugenioides TaxID=49369 RepID=UPI000F60915C|nr:carbon catabolite repressor protein 4 homolog 1-like isoform X1 [Coffea eugenioides]
MGLEWEVQVRFPSNTPVAGIELNPWVRVNYKGSYVSPPNYALQFAWYRELSTLPKCVEDYVAFQDHASRDSSMTVYGGGLNQEKHGLLNSEDLKIVEGEGKTWIQVGSSRTYTPSEDDIDSSLRLVSVAIDDMGIKMSINVFVTTPVIRLPRPYPRHMIIFWSLRKFRNPKCIATPFKKESFRVLSYNILADLYTVSGAYTHCPNWALTWEYRRRNLLNEILSYDADILCLQEVQSDHFKNFFEPEFAKLGYSAIYKRKTKEVYSANEYVIDGCATFFRHDRFKIVIKYEVEYDKMALPVIEVLEPDKRNNGLFRLMKDNVALVVILEEKDNGRSPDAARSTICVANTHIHRGSDASDVRLFQVVNLIRGLEKIDSSGIPILICGDMNSLPGSDPHRFLINGEVGCFSEKFRDPLGIHKHLKLSHSMHLACAYAHLLDSNEVGQHQKEKMDYQAMEPLFTCFKPSLTGTLDYILYSKNRLKVDGLLKLLDYDSLEKRLLPSPLWSSDHVALMANFRVKHASRGVQYLSPPPDPWEQKQTN